MITRIGITILAFSLLLGPFRSNANAQFFGPREAACSFIGEVCHSALLAFARNPSLLCGTDETSILNTMQQAQEKVNALGLNRCDRHHAVAASGRITNALLQAVARNPSLNEGFAKIVEVCETGLTDALFTGEVNLDLEELEDALCAPAD